jgi:carbon monoxide dehydrogenase subunit G
VDIAREQCVHSLHANLAFDSGFPLREAFRQSWRRDLKRAAKRRLSADLCESAEFFMKVTGEITVGAPRAAVFHALRDARFFASCVEGIHDLNEIDDMHYTAVLETKVAYMRFKFNVAVEVVRVTEPEEIEAKIEGTPLGIVGRLTATSATKLVESGRETKVLYSVDSTLSGKLGSLGQPVLKAKAKEMERQFAERLRAAFAQESAGAAP